MADRAALNRRRAAWVEAIAAIPEPRRRALHAIQQMQLAEADMRALRANVAWDLYDQLGSWAKVGRAMRGATGKRISGSRARFIAYTFAPDRIPRDQDQEVA